MKGDLKKARGSYDDERKGNRERVEMNEGVRSERRKKRRKECEDGMCEERQKDTRKGKGF